MLININKGMYFIPSAIVPFLIVATIIEEKKDVMIKETKANILKSPGLMEIFVSVNIMLPEAGISTLETMFPMIPISCPDNANNTGAAMIAANVIKMT